MKKLAAIICSATMTIGSLSAPAAIAAPIQPLNVATPAPGSDIQQVRYRRGFGPRIYRWGPRRGFHRGFRRGGWGWGPGPFIAGAIIGSALVAPGYYGSRYHYYGPRSWPLGYRYERCTSWRQNC
jgi:hypothetical protein